MGSLNCFFFCTFYCLKHFESFFFCTFLLSEITTKIPNPNTIKQKLFSSTKTIPSSVAQVDLAVAKVTSLIKMNCGNICQPFGVAPSIIDYLYRRFDDHPHSVEKLCFRTRRRKNLCAQMPYPPPPLLLLHTTTTSDSSGRFMVTDIAFSGTLGSESATRITLFGGGRQRRFLSARLTSPMLEVPRNACESSLYCFGSKQSPLATCSRPNNFPEFIPEGNKSSFFFFLFLSGGKRSMKWENLVFFEN